MKKMLIFLRSSVVLMLLGMILAACGKKSEVAIPLNPFEPAVAGDGYAGEAELAMLNELLREYVRKTKVVPRDLNELVRSGFVSGLPTAPPGRRFMIVLHPLGYSVVLVDN
jgi:hypothetical protein